VAGKVTEILDTAFWLKQGQADWFEPVAAAAAGRAC
jgi:hypothetical protein